MPPNLTHLKGWRGVRGVLPLGVDSSKISDCISLRCASVASSELVRYTRPPPDSVLPRPANGVIPEG